MSRHSLALLASASLLLRCMGETQGLDELALDSGAPTAPGASDEGVSLEPCTDPATCCPPSRMECLPQPDDQPICKCYMLWTCDQSQMICSQPLPTPQGGTGWTCTWTAQAYSCTGTSTSQPGAGAWTCVEIKANEWRCDRPFPPNPTNASAGLSLWGCVIDEASQTLSCTRPTSPPPPTSTPGSCKPGSVSFSAPGSQTFAVPSFEALTVELWGGGGGGSAYGQIESPTAGGASSFDTKVIAGGGGAGNPSVAAPGGSASGGSTNTSGGQGSTACAQYLDLCAGRVTRIGGDAPSGGAGGKKVLGVDACASYMFGSAAGDGEDGQVPGGGGAGDNTCQLNWMQQQGWGMGGAGGGAGAHAKITYAKGQLTPGASVTVVVGAGGRGSRGAVSSQAPGTGKNPGYYTGGDGARGEVRIGWTCQ